MTAPVSDATSRAQPSPSAQAFRVIQVGATALCVVPDVPASSHDSSSGMKWPLYSIFTSRSAGST